MAGEITPQSTRYVDNSGWYGSLQLFRDIISPLLEPSGLAGKAVVDIGSGSGRIVGMLLNAGAAHVYAVEPSSEAFAVLEQNVRAIQRQGDVSCINEAGDRFSLTEQVDYMFSVGVIHHIPDPVPVIERAFEALKPGGHIFLWLYGYEGNESYLRVIEPIRQITTRLPHVVLRGCVEIMYYLLCFYRSVGRLIAIPLSSYIENILWPLSPKKRRLVIYDQLNPAFAKYYREHAAFILLQNSGFVNIKTYHRHGYSWSVIGQKPTI